MKYYVEIINSLNAGSVDNVHIYSMFEAQDTVENMAKVLYPVYHDQIKQLLQSSFTLKDGRAFKVFLGGDYHFLDDNMGHQGSGTKPLWCATYPTVEFRTVQDYIENYNENLADCLGGKDLHQCGKHHYGVVGRMIFPLENLDQVVPASLHILFGVVLLLYNLLLNYCKEIDNEGDNITQQQIQKDLVNQELAIASLELEKDERLMHEHGKNVVTMINFQS